MAIEALCIYVLSKPKEWWLKGGLGFPVITLYSAMNKCRYAAARNGAALVLIPILTVENKKAYWHQNRVLTIEEMREEALDRSSRGTTYKLQERHRLLVQWAQEGTDPGSS